MSGLCFIIIIIIIIIITITIIIIYELTVHNLTFKGTQSVKGPR